MCEEERREEKRIERRSGRVCGFWCGRLIEDIDECFEEVRNWSLRAGADAEIDADNAAARVAWTERCRLERRRAGGERREEKGKGLCFERYGLDCLKLRRARRAVSVSALSASCTEKYAKKKKLLLVLDTVPECTYTLKTSTRKQCQMQYPNIWYMDRGGKKTKEQYPMLAYNALPLPTAGRPVPTNTSPLSPFHHYHPDLIPAPFLLLTCRVPAPFRYFRSTAS